jgi:amino acid transporter
MAFERKNRPGLFGSIKRLFIGEARNPLDQKTMHNISLIAFFAWVGLGSDGLSSSCYGPSEAFITLGKHFYLGLLIALATGITIFIIAESYSQIIELFPSGGGGYIVASKLLNPTLGMISGCALLIDYVLTITLSIASGADALFSFMPLSFLVYRLWFAVLILIVLIVLNLRGVKESVTVLMPIFIGFVVTHAVILLYALGVHSMAFPSVVHSTVVDVKTSVSELGLMGVFLLMLRAYSLGAGTYTGIEAVSNGLPILREPKVKTAKATMRYMVISLTAVVVGLMFAYTLYHITLVPGKTLNAVLFERIAGGWGTWGYSLILFALISEAAILFVAAQTGFLDGPRVLANMAADRWAPKRFALLSDRLVTMNGIVIMGLGSLILLLATKGSVGFLVVLYSINVFITFCLSQLGMVRHWWAERNLSLKWFTRISVNGIGLILTTFILFSVTIIKFNEGGWITLFITGSLVLIMMFIRMSYDNTNEKIKKLDRHVIEVESTHPVRQIPMGPCEGGLCDINERTAVVLVKDFTGIGLEGLFTIFKSFGTTFKNFVFVQVGLIDAGAFSRKEELEKVKDKVTRELDRYVALMRAQGYNAEGKALFGIDTVELIGEFAHEIRQKYPNCTFFGGQIAFKKNDVLSRLLHNYTLFAIQDRLYKEGLPLFVLPIELPE